MFSDNKEFKNLLRHAINETECDRFTVKYF